MGAFRSATTLQNEATQASLFAADQAVEFELPQLNYGPISLKIGTIQCVLRTAEKVTAIPQGEIRISARTKEQTYKLPSGDLIIVTTRKRLDRPAGVDAVLFRNEDGKLNWQSHRLIDDMTTTVERDGWPTAVRKHANLWSGKFRFISEKPEPNGEIKPGNEGLRPPQIGALHAIGAHWSLGHQPATIVMPTGTGKTETILSTQVAYGCYSILVIVPTDALRSQTARKFLTFGLLRKLKVLAPDAPNPIVGIIRKRPRTIEDLEIFDRCNVVISTMAALKTGKVDDEEPAEDGIDTTDDEEEQKDETFSLTQEIAKRVKLLVVDEAHHIPAPGWAAFRGAFRDIPVIQFTATPFRRDGRLVDGQVIYNFPLRKAQEDKYFKPITLNPVYEPTHDKSDHAIAQLAVTCLKDDLNIKKLNHLMMARCKNITRATEVHAIYEKLAPDLKPILIHSQMGDTSKLIDDLRAGKHRIVVCVNMLGEGFDLPELKVAAIHDLHKSLAVLLQFTGRFTRSSASNISDATVIANIAEPSVSGALERLYSEDADWNYLLSELSSEAAKDHIRLINFLKEAKPLLGEEDDSDTSISRQLLRPTLSTLVFEANRFRPKNFYEGLPKHLIPYRAWLHGDDTLFFVTKSEPTVKWSRSKAVRDREWALFVLHYDKKRKLLYLSSSDHSSEFRTLAQAVGADDLLTGEIIFRCLGRITRLLFQNIGLKKHGRRNLSYAMYTGAQVEEALGLSEKGGSTKSNLSGIGWEDGRQITIGCSAKGRIWSREQNTILRFNDWAESVGDKLRDNTIDMKDLLANVLIPTEVTALPDSEILCIEWPLELLRQAEERITFRQIGKQATSLTCDISVISMDRTANAIDFQFIEAKSGQWGTFRFSLGGERKFSVVQTAGATVHINIGKNDIPLADYFSNYPPLFRLVDLTELDADLHIRPQNPQELILPQDHFEAWDWTGVDFTKESMWKDGVKRNNSIQEHVAKFFIEGNFDIVFDDDAANEAADLVCLKEGDDHIRVAFIHCKYAGGMRPGERIKDVVEVSSQAVRSTKWSGQFPKLCSHLKRRDNDLKTDERPTRFLKGSSATLNQFIKMSRIKPIRTEIIIAQPGLTKKGMTKDQSQVLSSALTYIKQTIDVDMGIICSE